MITSNKIAIAVDLDTMELFSFIESLPEFDHANNRSITTKYLAYHYLRQNPAALNAFYKYLIYEKHWKQRKAGLFRTWIRKGGWLAHE